MKLSKIKAKNYQRMKQKLKSRITQNKSKMIKIKKKVKINKMNKKINKKMKSN